MGYVPKEEVGFLHMAVTNYWAVRDWKDIFPPIRDPRQMNVRVPESQRVRAKWY